MICNSEKYDDKVGNDKACDSLIEDISKDFFDELLKKCNKHNKNDTVFYLSLPRIEELIGDFYRITYSAIRLKDIVKLDKNDEEDLLVSIERVAKSLSEADYCTPLAIIKMDKSGTVLRIYQEEE